VARVVAAVRDPNPGVSGGGLKELRRAGIECEVGLLEAEAERLNEGFFARMRRGRPWVILKTALSLDGKAHCEGGASRWITGPVARALVHDMRASCDAVLVGIGTALADDPALTAHGAGKNPLRVLLDTQLRLPSKAKLLDGSAPTVIFTASPRQLKGAECVRIRHSHGRLPLKMVLEELSRRGIGRLLVEGGPTVHAAFLREGLVDEAQVFIAPKLISGTRDPNAGPRVESAKLRRVGEDLLVSGRLRCSPV
jgi:diaminohydroxyphosphoribosylaminopyrimidine deaminase/5-amino-6-(5-phosphoribosylamino)uracil reductase